MSNPSLKELADAAAAAATPAAAPVTPEVADTRARDKMETFRQSARVAHRKAQVAAMASVVAGGLVSANMSTAVDKDRRFVAIRAVEVAECMMDILDAKYPDPAAP